VFSLAFYVSVAFYEFFMFKLVLFILPVICSVLLLFIYVNVCLLVHVCDCFYMYAWCILCVLLFVFNNIRAHVCLFICIYVF